MLQQVRHRIKTPVMHVTSSSSSHAETFLHVFITALHQLLQLLLHLLLPAGIRCSCCDCWVQQLKKHSCGTVEGRMTDSQLSFMLLLCSIQSSSFPRRSLTLPVPHLLNLYRVCGGEPSRQSHSPSTSRCRWKMLVNEQQSFPSVHSGVRRHPDNRLFNM